MSSFYFNGLLNVPDGITIVWSDDGMGMVPDADKVLFIFYLYFIYILFILYFILRVLLINLIRHFLAQAYTIT